ncbi:MAG TPA: ribose-phosphate pyrophosphokinase [bacterium]|nr:ribose-phosphate pyrophosphokinase [bacterium]
MKYDIMLVSGRANRVFAEGIAKRLNIYLGKVEIVNFSDGEIFVKYDENVRGKDLFIVQPTFPNSDNLMELLIMIDAAKRSSAARITAVIPYFGYARQDRKDQPRVPITAKLVANLLTTAGVDRILTMDLHSAQIQGFFDIPMDHLYSSAVLTEYWRGILKKDAVIVSPDMGGVKLARAYAKRLELDFSIIDKRRPKANSVEIMNIIGHVEGRDVLLIDDMIDTAGTLTQAASALKEHGAQDIYAACTHPILSGNAIEKIMRSPIKKVVATDTIPMRASCEKIEILSVTHVFAEAISRIHKAESISVLSN